MKLYLIRHGETVDNVAQLYAGTTDSALTSHGHVQTTKLGSHLAEAKVKFSHVFSSDLQRARKTAESLINAQHSKFGKSKCNLDLVQLQSLREQDFGSLERCSFTANRKSEGKPTTRHAAKLDRSHPDFREVESKDSMALRTSEFIEKSLLPIMMASTAELDEPIVAIVSHGMTLLALWRSLLQRFALFSVTVAPGVSVREDRAGDFKRMVGWSNTGFLELDIQHHPSQHTAIKATKGVITSLSPSPSKAKKKGSIVLYDWKMTVLAINHTPHLRGVKRTRGGVGSSKHQEDQKPLDSYFKKRRKVE